MFARKKKVFKTQLEMLQEKSAGAINLLYATVGH